MTAHLPPADSPVTQRFRVRCVVVATTATTANDAERSGIDGGGFVFGLGH